MKRNANLHNQILQTLFLFYVEHAINKQYQCQFYSHRVKYHIDIQFRTVNYVSYNFIFLLLKISN